MFKIAGEGGRDARYVKSTSPLKALVHVARSVFTVTYATQQELERAAERHYPIEDADAAAEQLPPGSPRI